MTLEFFQEKPTDEDLKLIEVAAKQIFYVLYQCENISRVNTIRALVTVIEQAIEEWMIEIGLALKEEVEDEKELKQIIFQNYMDTHIAVVLSCVGHIAGQSKRAPVKILKQCIKMLERKHGKGLIIPGEEDKGIIIP